MTAREQMERSLDRARERARTARTESDETQWEREVRRLESAMEWLEVSNG
jgi:hypothetical protein